MLRSFASLILLAVFITAAYGQRPPVPSTYSVYREVALSASGDAVTIQQPASPSRFIRMRGATVSCSAACVVVVERDGDPATETAETPVRETLHDKSNSTALAFFASDTADGVVRNRVPLASDVPAFFDFSGMTMDKEAGQNVTVRVESFSGTLRLFINWEEY